MKPRKGRRMKVVKNRKVIAICENKGDAMRLTKISLFTIAARLKDGGTSKGYRFIPLEES